MPAARPTIPSVAYSHRLVFRGQAPSATSLCYPGASPSGASLAPSAHCPLVLGILLKFPALATRGVLFDEGRQTVLCHVQGSSRQVSPGLSSLRLRVGTWTPARALTSGLLKYKRRIGRITGWRVFPVLTGEAEGCDAALRQLSSCKRPLLLTTWGDGAARATPGTLQVSIATTARWEPRGHGGRGPRMPLRR